jgi:GntR family transcriptional regulator / MocR family aminotransferase
MTSPQAEDVVAACSVEALPLERFTLKSPDPKGVLLGFAAIHEITTRKALVQLAAALSSEKRRGN